MPAGPDLAPHQLLPARAGHWKRAARNRAAVEVDLIDRGYVTYRASAPGGADIVAERGGRWTRLKVVAGYRRSGGLKVPRRAAWAASVDVLAIVVDGRIEYSPRLAAEGTELEGVR